MSSSNGSLCLSDEEFEFIDNKLPSENELISSAEKLSMENEELSLVDNTSNDSLEISAVEAKADEILKKSAEENVPSGMRIICFRKVNGKFGARHFGNLISFVDKNGPAGLAGLLKGDQIISINGINVETLSKDNINAVSKNVSDDVTLVVRFNPERLADLISDK